MKSAILLSAAVAGLMLAGCESTGWNNSSASNDQMDRSDWNPQYPSQQRQQNPNALTGNANLGEIDRQFLMDGASGGLYEVQSSQLALQKSSDDKIRSLAQRLIDDHTRVNDQLKRLAQDQGVALPASLNLKHQNMYDKLSNTTGRDFDTLYLRQQVDAHREAITLFKHESEQGTSSDLKQFASTHLPTLQQHLDQVLRTQANDKTPDNNPR